MTSLIDEPDLVICDPDDEHVPAELELELEFEFLYAAVEVDERAARPALAKTFLQAAVMATPVVILGLLSWTHRNMFADGYIYLHVVQNVLAGNGPVFDAGQRVEAVTSPTWTAILSVVGLVTRLPLTWIAVGLGVAFSVAGISLALAASGHLVRRVTPHGFLVPLGAVAFVALPPVWSLATTGLETGLVFLWLGSCFALLVRWSRTEGDQLSRLGLVVLGIGFLIRPELCIESAVFIAVLLLSERSGSWRLRARVVTWACITPLAYEVFRMGYYASLFANTAITKEAALPSPGRGVAYFSDFVGPYWLFIPIGALLFGAYFPLARSLNREPRQRRSFLALLALPIAGSINAGYIILIGGDYIHARLFMAPFFAVCAPVAAVAMTRRTSIALLVVPWAAVCALSLRTTDSTPWSSPSIISINGHGSFASPTAFNGDPTKVAALSSSPAVYVQLASPTSVVRLEGAIPPGISRPTIATSWIGPESYQLGPNVDILDLLGLADPLTSHLRLARRGAIAGHEKPLPTAWIAAALGSSGSTIAQLDSLQSERPQYFTPLTAMASGSQLRVQIAWANAALQCPAIKDLLSSTTTPLTFGSFMSNIYHSYSRATLRIPPNPQTAFHTYCGSGTPTQVKSLLSER